MKALGKFGIEISDKMKRLWMYLDAILVAVGEVIPDICERSVVRKLFCGAARYCQIADVY